MSKTTKGKIEVMQSKAGECMSSFNYVIFASYGNDSIALIQFAHEKDLRDVAVVYSDTGWAADWWLERVEQGEALAKKYGFSVFRTTSEGMPDLVRRKKGWPMGGGPAFCTAELKVLPGIAWLDEHDPEKEATCLTGVRREESQNRKDAPQWVTESKRHGGRELWQPLVNHKEQQRDALIEAAGFKVLPHRSMECYPCVHANIDDIRRLTPERIKYIESLENELGINSKGNPRVMFRPKRHKGATGIREVFAWAKVIRPSKDQQDLFPCSSGWCGM